MFESKNSYFYSKSEGYAFVIHYGFQVWPLRRNILLSLPPFMSTEFRGVVPEFHWYSLYPLDRI